jgi:hypothetical protein
MANGLRYRVHGSLLQSTTGLPVKGYSSGAKFLSEEAAKGVRKVTVAPARNSQQPLPLVAFGCVGTDLFVLGRDRPAAPGGVLLQRTPVCWSCVDTGSRSARGVRIVRDEFSHLAMLEPKRSDVEHVARRMSSIDGALIQLSRVFQDFDAVHAGHTDDRHK